MTQKQLIYIALALAVLYVATRMGKSAGGSAGGWPGPIGEED